MTAANEQASTLNAAQQVTQLGQQQACLRLRGLPFSATQAQLVEWFYGYTVLDALITTTDGKPNGQAFVLLPEADALRAQVELNNKYMGKRFIEVFSSTPADMDTARRLCAEQQRVSPATGAPPQRLARQRASSAGGGASSNTHKYIVRLRGLPFSATTADVRAFLAPIELPDGVASVQLARHPDLRPTGEAYVQLGGEADVMAALKKHKQSMGKRYIEVFPSCLAELQQAMLLPKPGCGQDVFAAGLMSVPAGNPAAHAAWLAQQQQMLQLQQHMQLQAAQKVLVASVQQQQQWGQQQQVAGLQTQAQLQQLQAQMQQMQLANVASQQQQPQEVLIALPGGMLGPATVQQPHQQQQRPPPPQVLSLSGGLGSPSYMSAPHIGASLASSSLANTCGGNTSSSSMLSSVAGGMQPGLSMSNGLAAAAAAAAAAGAGGLPAGVGNATTTICSPSAMDMQYVPFFSSAAAASHLALQEQLQLQAPGNGGALQQPVLLQQPQQQHLSGPTVLSGDALQPRLVYANLPQPSVFAGAELLSSTSNGAIDGGGMQQQQQLGGGACGVPGAPPPLQ